MDRHTSSGLARIEVVETGRRRRWSEEEKARIVLESLSGPRLVSATARRYELSRSQLLTWRRSFAVGRINSGTSFVGAVVAADGPVAPAASSSRSGMAQTGKRRIEIDLVNGRRVIVDSDVDVEALGRIVEALDRQ